MNLPAVHAVKLEPFVAGKGFGFGGEFLPKTAYEFVHTLSPNISHHHKHGVLHGRVVDGAEVPNAAMDQDVDVGGRDPRLAQQNDFGVFQSEGREEYGVLKCEIMLRVEVDGLQP